MNINLEISESGVNKMTVNIASQDDAERARLFFTKIGDIVNGFDEDLKKAAKRKVRKQG